MASREGTRFGVVGLSSDHVWGMGDGLTELAGVSIVAAADPDSTLRARAAEQWSLDVTYADYAELLERQRPDAILVCCDNVTKPSVVEAAARYGVHVYQDKPMAASLAGADRSLRAATKADITLMIAYHSAFNPVYDQVKEALAAESIGRVYLARGSVGHGGPVEFGCSPNFCEWLFDRDRNGGGTFIDEACYVIDEFVDYLGQIIEVSAFTAQIGHRDYLPADVEDNAVAILRFATGALGLIDSKWGQVGPYPVRTSYHGTTGTIVTSRTGSELTTKASPALERWVAGEPDPDAGLRVFRPAASAAGSGRRGAEQRRFQQCLVDGTPIPRASSPELARHVQEVIEAVYLSAENRRAVTLPLPVAPADLPGGPRK